MSFQPEQPFNDLPDLPPAAELETMAVLKRCIRARAALGELKQAGALIPNPSVLINTLPLLEARDSTEIENIVTTSDRLFRFAASEQRGDPATREALRYRKALAEGFASLESRPLCTATAVRICQIIKDAPLDVRKVPGTRLANATSGEVIYTPPEGEALLRDKLANWERFIHQQDALDPLVRLAVAHYQFEAIHPFTDGNGRTGRVLNSLFLIETGLLTLPILYLSRYMLQHRADYYRLLLGVTREQAWEAWLLFMLQGIEETALWTLNKITAIRGLMTHTIEYVQSALPMIYSRELLDLIFEQPYCRIANLVSAGIAQRQTASEYLKKLESIGVLRQEQVGREKLFIHSHLMQLLTEESNTFTPYPRTREES